MDVFDHVGQVVPRSEVPEAQRVALGAVVVDGVGEDLLVRADVEDPHGEVIGAAGEDVLVEDDLAGVRGDLRLGACASPGRRGAVAGDARARAGRRGPRPSTWPAERDLLGSGRRQCTGYCWPARVRDQYHQPPWNAGVEMSVSAARARICSNKRSCRPAVGASTASA